MKRVTNFDAHSQARTRHLVKGIQSDVESFEQLWRNQCRNSTQSPQHDLVGRWIYRLQETAKELADRYVDKNEFQCKLEESLMLAAGLNRALLDEDAGPALRSQWARIRGGLNVWVLQTASRAYSEPSRPEQFASKVSV
jgi:hypothetical protein